MDAETKRIFITPPNARSGDDRLGNCTMNGCDRNNIPENISAIGGGTLCCVLLTKRNPHIPGACQDAAGNVDPTPATHSWTIQLSAQHSLYLPLIQR
jgi:hypothetical protein